MGTSIDYSTASHETIYQHITGGPGYAGMVEMSRGWQSVATQMQQFRSAVEEAVRGIGLVQQGAAADAATHSTSALMPWLDQSVTAANVMAARVSEQAASFAHTRDSMPPPRTVPEVSFSQDPTTWTVDHAIEWLPGIQTQNEADHVAAQQDQERARELMASYQGTSNGNLGVREYFVAAPTVVAEVVDPTPGGGGVGGGSGGGSPQLAPGEAHPTLAHSAAHPGPAAGVPTHAAPAGTAPPLASAAAATTPQLAGGIPSSAEQPMTGSGAVRSASAEPFGPSPILTASNGADQLRGGSRYSGGVPRGGSFGPRPTVFSAGGSHLNEPRLSSSAAYGSAEQASAEQARAGRAARGTGGWGDAALGAAGGSGRDGDSREHRRARYLIEQDTNAIVGELPRTAPPVIGAAEDYR
ncbi:MAG: PPE domain-containing protein [Pseudonocardiaceae bacterium]